uniref:MRG domain-containing protein n=1 Tax=Hyaloperonospora arabidopsidis (strain Emoy2) TaxID=559515 RepID=M4BF63_HYAAE
MSGSSKQVNLQMTFSLKKQLVEDWKRVTQAPHELVPLPRKPNVQQMDGGSSIVKMYLYVKQSKVHAGEAGKGKSPKT